MYLYRRRLTQGTVDPRWSNASGPMLVHAQHKSEKWFFADNGRFSLKLATTYERQNFSTKTFHYSLQHVLTVTWSPLQSKSVNF